MKSKKDLKNKNIEKNNAKGITLIALVITIIVLLILAGVSIAMLTGDNGIITQANNAKVANEKATAKEKVEMEVGGSRGTDGKLDYGLLEENLNNIKDIDGVPSSITEKSFPLEVTVDGYKVKIESNGTVTVEGETTGGTGDGVITISSLDEIKGKYYEKDTTISIGEQTIAIPGGATVSGITEECKTIDDGLVIYITNGETITDWSDTETIQKTYDQFVWIPVNKEMAIIEEGKEITGSSNTEKYTSLKTFVETNCKTSGNYPMAVKKSDGTYSGILYAFTAGTSGVNIVPQDYTTTSSYREPAFLTSYDTSNGGSVGITQNPDSLQGEYKTMIESVEQKGGFWVGRYETTNMNSSNFTTTPVTSIKGITTGISNVTWYKMYEGQKTYKTAKLTQSTKTTSSMIWGSQWDQIMIWMRNVKNGDKYYITNSVGMGNFGTISGVNDGYSSTTSPANAGCFDVKNVFDLAGNVRDWTLEAYNTFFRVGRGGAYNGSNSSGTRADNRSYGSYGPTGSYSGDGSRLTLY